jgi:K+-transporting ATPase A subunit
MIARGTNCHKGILIRIILKLLLQLTSVSAKTREVVKTRGICTNSKAFEVSIGIICIIPFLRWLPIAAENTFRFDREP